MFRQGFLRDGGWSPEDLPWKGERVATPLPWIACNLELKETYWKLRRWALRRGGRAQGSHDLPCLVREVDVEGGAAACRFCRGNIQQGWLSVSAPDRPAYHYHLVCAQLVMYHRIDKDAEWAVTQREWLEAKMSEPQMLTRAAANPGGRARSRRWW